MGSHSSNSTRRSPQQERSTKRVSAFLGAAEALFTEVGYEAATMTAIAERAGSSIGALYGYFPDKNTIAVALLDKYSSKIEEKWQPLFDEIDRLSVVEFSDRLIDRFLEFTGGHPAFLQLAAGPTRLRRSDAAKRAFRAPLVEALLRRMPALSQQRGELCANVILQMVYSMVRMYKDADAKARGMIVSEYKTVLAAYLNVSKKSARGQ